MKYRREIDGLRALAVLPVILFHAGYATFSGGFVGVDIFFVISGYLITTILINEMEQGSFSIAKFYERRARRILPALFFVILCTIPFAWLWMLPQDFRGFSQSLAAVPLFASNILFFITSNYFDTSSDLKPLLHTWSLAVEEQYYVFFPLVMMFTWKLGKKWLFTIISVLAIFSIIAAEWFVSSNPSFAFYLLPTRAFEILLGALVAFYLNNKSANHNINNQYGQFASVLGLLLIIYSILAFNKHTPSPSLLTLIPVVGTCLVIAFANSKNIVGKILGLKILVGIGLISYSSYLWHQPLLAMARLRSFDNLDEALILLICVLSLALGYLSWRFIEAPFRKNDVVKTKYLVISLSITALFIIMLGIVGYKNNGFPQRFDEKTAYIANLTKMHDQLREDNICFNFSLGGKLLNCIKGNPNATPKVMLLGDSHAAAITYELEQKFKSRGISFINQTKSACLPILEIAQSPDKGCSDFIRSSLEKAKELKIDTIILIARWSYYTTQDGFDNKEGGKEERDFIINSINGVSFDEPIELRKNKILSKVKENIERLTSEGMKVILVYPIPQNGWTPSTRLAKNILFNNKSENISTSHSLFIEETKYIYAALDQINGNNKLYRVYPEKIFCNTKIEDRCFATHSDIVYYYDDDHLSNDGARLVVSEIDNNL